MYVFGGRTSPRPSTAASCLVHLSTLSECWARRVHLICTNVQRFVFTFPLYKVIAETTLYRASKSSVP